MSILIYVQMAFSLAFLKTYMPVLSFVYLSLESIIGQEGNE